MSEAANSELKKTSAEGFLVPINWSFGPLKYFGRLNGGAGFPEDEQGKSDGEIPFYKVKDLALSSQDWVLEGPENYIDLETAKKLRAYIFKESTIVFAKVGAALLLRRFRLLPRESVVDNNMMGFETSAKNCSRYFLYAMSTIKFDDIVNPGAVPSINEKQIGSIKLFCPPEDEQQTIANFLDRETAKIDELIQKQQKLIKLAEEERRAIINHAICKGLDKKIKLKDSGISWLDDVPAHWNIKPLKYLISLNDEVLPESTPEDFELKYVEIGDVSERFGITSSTEVVYKNAASRARRLVKHGDILISTVRTYLRAIAPVMNPPSNMVVSTGFAVVRPQSINNDYARFLLSTEYFLNEVISRSTGVSYPAINASDLVQIKVPVPPIEEQEKIAEYIQKKCVTIELLVNKSESSIKFFREHRASLILAAVTGKIDVRGLE